MKKLGFLTGTLLIALGAGLLNGQVTASDDPVRKIVVGGTGDSQAVLRKLAGLLEKKIPQARIEVPDSIGTTGGIKALLAGKIDLARTARALKAEEKAQGLDCTLFARSPVVFVVNPGTTDVNTITADQILGIYSGRITNWNQLGSAVAGKIYAITREKGDSCLQVLNTHVAGLKDVNEPVAKIMYSTPETTEILLQHKGTFGFLPLSAALGTPLRILAFEEIRASPQNVNEGRYKPVIPLGIVHKGRPEGLSKQFVDFLFSPEGRQILSEMGAIPVPVQDPNKTTSQPQSPKL